MLFHYKLVSILTFVSFSIRSDLSAGVETGMDLKNFLSSILDKTRPVIFLLQLKLAFHYNRIIPKLTLTCSYISPGNMKALHNYLILTRDHCFTRPKLNLKSCAITLIFNLKIFNSTEKRSLLTCCLTRRKT